MNVIDLSRYDSTAGVASIKTQTNNGAENSMAITNISHKINFNDEFYVYDYNILAPYKLFLSQFIVKAKCPESLYYHPELVAKLLYGSIDLWYLVMMFNSIPSAAEFTQPVIDVFDPGKIEYINLIIKDKTKELKFNKAQPDFVEKHTLTPIKIKNTRLI